ncbi:MAG: carbon storage regulator CsrA [Deltaproteobacteria bacterium]|nr:carbon storage regulator CsrA [Deltaproteobacteria bacterium]
MLVLTRKVGERINIGDDIIISVIETDRGSVRLGIEAPRHIPILRQEIYERIQEQNLQSSQGVFEDIEKAADLWRKKRSHGAVR